MNKHILLGEYVNMVIGSHVYLLTIRGAPGLGKTTLITEKLREKKLEENKDYVILSGHVTPPRLFALFWKSKIMTGPKLFVFDDVDSIMSNKTSLALLKASLSETNGKRIITYETAKNTDDPLVPSSFEFEGRVIIMVNNMKQERAVGQSLLDRGIFYDMTLNPEELSEYVEQILEKINVDITKEEKEAVWDKIKRFTDRPGFSLRTVERALKFYRYNRTNWYELWLPLIKKQ